MTLRKTLFLSVIILVTLFCGCTNMRYFTIDTLQSPKEFVVQKSARILLVDRAFDSEKKDCGHYYNFDFHIVFDTTCREKNLADAYMIGMQEIIDDSQIFSVSEDIVTAFPTKDEPYNQPLSATSINEIAQHSDANVLLSLDAIKFKDATHFVPVTSYDAYAYTAAIFTVTLRFYDIATQSITASRVITDTLYWYSQEMDYNRLLSLSTSRDDILNQLAYEAGKKITSKIFPAWVTVNRVLFVSYDSASENGAEAAINGNWERANDYWDAVIKENKKTKTAAALFNKSVGEEIKGNFETAIDYVQQADNLKKRKLHQDYIEVLQQRIKNDLKLKDEE